MIETPSPIYLAKERAAPKLMEIPCVQGVAITWEDGSTEGDTIAILVSSLAEAAAVDFPTQIEGFPVVLQEVGLLEALSVYEA